MDRLIQLGGSRFDEDPEYLASERLFLEFIVLVYAAADSFCESGHSLKE
jgi:hypothetical protein